MADNSELPDLTFGEIKKLKVIELKTRLSNLGLPVSGLKADLVARLASFLESRAIQAAFDEVKIEKADDGGSDNSGGDKGSLVELHGKGIPQPDELGGPSHVPDIHEQVYAVVSEIVTEVTAEKLEGDTTMNTSDVTEPSVEMVGEVIEDVIDVDTVEEAQKDTMQVEQTMKGKENIDVADEKEREPEEKEPEIQQEDTGNVIQEERGVEVQPDRGVDSQPDEVGIEVRPEETRVEPDQIDSMETAPGTQTIEQIPESVEEQIMVEQHQVEMTEEIGSDIGAGGLVEPKFDQGKEAYEPQPIHILQSEPEESVLPAVVEPGVVGEEIFETGKSGSHVEDMETVSEILTQGAPQKPAISVETRDIVEDKQSQSSHVPPEEPLQPSLEPHPTSPHPPPLTITPPSPHQVHTHPPFEAATHPQSQSQQMSETPSPKASIVPPHLQGPSHRTSHIPSHSPLETANETEPTTMDKTRTPPRSASQIDSPREPTPQEDIPLKHTPPRGISPKQKPPSPRKTIPPPPDPLAEAKAKARIVVEMRERRLNEESQVRARGDDSGYDVDHYEQERIPAAEPRQEKRKKKKKKRKKRNNEQTNVESEAPPDDEGIEVEYVPETLDFNDPVYAQFASIFETFKLSEKEEPVKKDEAKEKSEDKITEAAKKDDDDDEMDTDSEDEETQKKEEKPGEKVEKLSKKKLKLKNRMSVAELKQTIHRPDVVEMHDVTAPDPKLLVYLKACRNTVPVPRHWCFKRKFLQGKRGIIKPPFQLPEFIQKTGIMEMREALQEKEDAKNMKAKMREKIRPKMGKIDIDYQKLHDAFFKWQTKPKMSIHGDLYYEGKEFETKLKEKKPGDLSEDLRTALGMPTGQGSNLVPPPWLIAMQRYGPPPSYPNLKIRGLNAPIPEGASFGYHAGGWGKPPVDEHGRPLYGDVFGVQETDGNIVDDELVDSNLWGELESESEESEESEEESEEEAPDQSGLVTPAETGLVTPSGLTSIPAGMETPDMIELRKRKNIEDAMESGSEQQTLYTVLPEKRAGVGGMMMGTSHVYDLATAAAPTGTRKTPGGLSEGVEVALDPSELELDPAAMQARYDEQLREQQNTQKEDFSDMVAEHAARQQKKRKKTTDSGKAAKKYKEFKF